MRVAVTQSTLPGQGAAPFQCCVCGPAECSVFLSDVPDRLGIVRAPSTLVRCTSCGLISLYPRPSFEETSTFYPQSFWRTEVKSSAPPSLASRFETWYRERLIQADFALIAEFLRPGLRHLDVGCATGDFIVLCQSRGTISTGIELSEPAARYCREERGLDVIAGDLTSTSFGEQKFDVITYNAVLEHVPDPYAHLVKCRALLAPGGRLILLGLPNIDSVGFRLTGKQWINLDAPRHIHQFSRESLTRLLTKAGFSPLQIDFRSPRFNPTTLVASVIPALHRHKFDAQESSTGSNPLLKKALLLALLQAARPLDFVFSRLGLGENMSCIAEVTP